MTEVLDPATEGWIDPASLSEEELSGLTKSLDALFAPPKEEKRDYPHELSTLIKSVFGKDRLVYGINAGDGSQFTAFDPAFSFGIEPDEKRSRKRQGRYNAVVGELNRLSKLFEPLGADIGDTIVVLREKQRTEDILDFLNANLESRSMLAYIVPTGTSFEELPGVYVGVELEDTTIFFGFDPDYLEEDRPEIITRKSTLDTIDLLGPWVQEQKDLHLRSDYRTRDQYYAKRVKESWTAIHREYGRRYLRPEKVYDLALIGGNALQYEPSPWVKQAMDYNTSLGDLRTRLNGREIKYFAQNSGLWRELLICEDQGYLMIDPRLTEAIAPIIEDAERITTPLRPLKPQERLGFLGEQSKIKCLVDDEGRDLKAGKYYTVSLHPESYERYFTATENVKNVLQLVRKKRRYFHQNIKIDGRHNFYDDDPENIRYLLKHFQVPEKRDIRTRYPELIEAEDTRIAKIETDYLKPRGYAFKDYQKRDIAALSVNNRGICAWQQGLGKTLGGLAFALNAAMKDHTDISKTPVLVIAPQDLIPQWQAEAEKFYGIELKWIGRHKGNGKNGDARSVKNADGEANISAGAIKNLIEARQIARNIKEGAGGFYITHYEALTMGGAKNLRKVEEPYTIRIEKEEVWVEGQYTTNKETGLREWQEGGWQTKEKEITTAQECPQCGGALNSGQLNCNRKVRKHHSDTRLVRCGWTRYTYRLPSIGQILSTVFRNGVIVVDEGTQIASSRGSTSQDSSQKTKAVCGLRSKHRLVMSGTPVKNFIAQAFWLLWWGIGDRSERFNYRYHGGKAKFAKDYTVVEWTYNDDTSGWHKQKEVGEVTNHTQLWAQLASVLLRRVKEDTGELIVKKNVHIRYAPLGYYQREQMDFWLRHFPDLFAEKYPNDPKVKRGVHARMAAILGLDHKLNYAAVLPETDPDFAWTNVPVSNYTPAALMALETVMALVKQNRRVLIGTDVKKATAWLSARLSEKGVTNRTMLKGSGETIDPQDRSKVVEEFQNGAMSVLCSTQKAIRLGHNLDKGSAVVLLGLDWDYETYAQFTERVHRLTSEKPIDVYIIIPGEKNLSLVGRKWDRIQDKAKGAGMAIDGHIPEQNEDPPDIAQIIHEMVEKGFPVTGSEIKESEIYEAWTKIPSIEAFEIPDGFTDDQATEWVIDWDKANAALDEYLIVKQEYLDEEAAIRAENIAALAELCQSTVDKAVCEALEAFFAGATAPIVEEPLEEEVATATNSFDSPLDSETAPELATTSTPSEALPTGDGGESEAAEEEGQLTLVAAEPDAVPPAAPTPPRNFMQELKDAAELHSLGILTDDEFAEVKATLIAALKQGTGVAA